jgi:hypothetical protein
MARIDRPDDTRFDEKYRHGFTRLRHRDGRGFLGRKFARNACIICWLPEITETLEDAHIHQRDYCLFDPPTLDRVFRLCKNHHHVYDSHIITTSEVIAADNAAFAAGGLRLGEGPSPGFDMLLIADLHSKKRIPEHEKAVKAVAARKPKPAAKPQAPEDFRFGWESSPDDTA